jgi:hypothetical protein
VRVAFFVLLLVNLAFFAWTQWLAPKEAELPVSPRVNAPPLQLAREASPSRGGGSCVTVGPFATNELAARARQTLTDSGYPSTPREETVSVPDGYWVYLEGPSTEAAERRLLERLGRGGIADAQAVGDGGARRISLGIFSDEGRAAAQSERVARLGLLPQIVGREKEEMHIWLDLALKSGAPPLEGQKFQAGESELEFRPCPIEDLVDEES